MLFRLRPQVLLMDGDNGVVVVVVVVVVVDVAAVVVVVDAVLTAASFQNRAWKLLAEVKSGTQNFCFWCCLVLPPPTWL